LGKRAGENTIRPLIALLEFLLPATNTSMPTEISDGIGCMLLITALAIIWNLLGQ